MNLVDSTPQMMKHTKSMHLKGAGTNKIKEFTMAGHVENTYELVGQRDQEVHQLRLKNAE